MSPTFKRSEKGNCIKGVLIGCTLLVVLIVMVMVGTYFYFKKHGAVVFSNLLTPVVEETLASSNLSQQDQDAIKEQFARVTDKLKAGEISNEHLVRFTDALVKGDIFYLFIFEMIEHKSIPESGLSKEEKESAALAIQRTKRGLVEGEFTQDQYVYIQKALPMETDGYGNEQPIENLTDDQLSALIGDLQIVNNQAEIPEGEYQIDYAKYVRELVDEILGEESTPEGASEVTGEIESATEVIEFASPSLN